MIAYINLLKNHYSNNYLINLLRTYKNQYPNITIRPKDLKLKKISRRVYGQGFYKSINGIAAVLRYVKEYIENDWHTINTARKTDTIIAIILMVSTNIKSRYLPYVTKEHLKELFEKEICVIHQTYQIKVILSPVFKRYYLKILNIIASTDKIFSSNVNLMSKTLRELIIQLTSKFVEENLGLQCFQRINEQTILANIL